MKLGQLDLQTEKKKWNYSPTAQHDEVNTSGIIDLNMEGKAIALTGYNPEEHLHDFALAQRFCPCTQSLCQEWYSLWGGKCSVCMGTLASAVGAIRHST